MAVASASVRRLGYLHVFQPDDELRPADANIVLIGVHAMWDGAADEQADSDRDGDGINDARPLSRRSGGQGRLPGHDGCPEIDNDKDGVPDSIDRCPMIPEDKDGFEDDDGCPELDNDKDGLARPEGQMPERAGGQGRVPGRGRLPRQGQRPGRHPRCQRRLPERARDQERLRRPRRLPGRRAGARARRQDRARRSRSLPMNSHVIQAASHPLLGRLAKLIKDHPEYVLVEIEGHADERRPECQPAAQSRIARKAVLEFLVRRGVERTRLELEGLRIRPCRSSTRAASTPG